MYLLLYNFISAKFIIRHQKIYNRRHRNRRGDISNTYKKITDMEKRLKLKF